MLEFDGVTILLEIINFLIIAAALNFLLFKPVVKRAEAQRIERERLEAELKRDREEAAEKLAAINERITNFEEGGFAPDFLAGLHFGRDLDDDRRAVFLRAVFADPFYFRYRNGQIHVNSAEQVEQLRRHREQAAIRARQVADASLDRKSVV